MIFNPYRGTMTPQQKYHFIQVKLAVLKMVIENQNDQTELQTISIQTNSNTQNPPSLEKLLDNEIKFASKYDDINNQINQLTQKIVARYLPDQLESFFKKFKSLGSEELNAVADILLNSFHYSETQQKILITLFRLQPPHSFCQEDSTIIVLLIKLILKNYDSEIRAFNEIIWQSIQPFISLFKSNIIYLNDNKLECNENKQKELTEALKTSWNNIIANISKMPPIFIWIWKAAIESLALNKNEYDENNANVLIRYILIRFINPTVIKFTSDSAKMTIFNLKSFVPFLAKVLTLLGDSQSNSPTNISEFIISSIHSANYQKYVTSNFIDALNSQAWPNNLQAQNSNEGRVLTRTSSVKKYVQEIFRKFSNAPQPNEDTNELKGNGG